MTTTEKKNTAPKETDAVVANQEALPFQSPVGTLHARLRAAFSRDNSQSNAADTDCLVVLEQFLKLTGWAQGPRRIFESMPHADELSTVSAFRSMLFHLGFTTTAEPASSKNLRTEYLPCFLRYEDGSVKLAEQRSRDSEIVIFDPSTGMRSSHKAEEVRATAIFPEKIEKSDTPQNAPSNSWTDQLLSVFSPHLRQIFYISFIINILALAPPIYVMAVYDKAVAAKSYDVLAGLTAGIAIIIAADYLLRRIRVQLQAYLGARLDEQLNETAFRHLLHLPLSHTEDAPIGSQLTRLRQMTSLHEAFTGPLASAVFDLPYIALFIIVIAFIGGSLVWAPISLIAIYALAACWAIPKTGALIKKSGEARSHLNNLMVEAVSSQKAINDLAAEHVWLRRHRKLSAESVVANMNARQINSLLQIFSQSMVALAGVGVLAFGVTMVIDGNLSGGALIAVMALSWRVLGPIRNLFL